MIHSRREQIETPDGGHIDGHFAYSEGERGPGILLLAEIFGVNEFLKSKAVDLAGAGYVVLCPDVFWRIEPRVSLHHDEASMRAAQKFAQRFEAIDLSLTTSDLLSGLDAVRSLPECDGRVGVMGYGLGGRLAYEVALAGTPDACVSYYGPGVADRVTDAGIAACPSLFHFGAKDRFIPMEEVDRVRTAVAGREDATVHVQPGAGHGFENSLALQFHDKFAAAQSWAVTLEFLRRTFPR